MEFMTSLQGDLDEQKPSLFGMPQRDLGYCHDTKLGLQNSYQNSSLLR